MCMHEVTVLLIHTHTINRTHLHVSSITFSQKHEKAHLEDEVDIWKSEVEGERENIKKLKVS